jgi:O-antigen/teichoic acid export membrane protein
LEAPPEHLSCESGEGLPPSSEEPSFKLINASSLPVAEANEVDSEPVMVREPQSLHRNFSWTLVGNLIYAASQWGMLVVLAKIGAPDHLGQYGLGIAIANPIFIFLSFHLRIGYVADVNDEFEYGDYLALRMITVPLATAMVVAAACLIDLSPSARLATAMVGFLTGATYLSDIFFAVPHRFQHMAGIGRSMALRGCLSLIVVSITLLITGNLALALGAVAAVWLVLALFVDARRAAQFRPIRPHWNARQLARLVGRMAPIAIGATLLILAMNVPLYVLKQQLGFKEVGYFLAIVSLLKVGDVVNTALMEAAVPKLAIAHAKSDGGLARLLVKIICFLTILNAVGVLLTVVFGELFLTYAYTPEYRVLYWDFVLISVVGVVSNIGVALSKTVTAMRFYWLQLGLNLTFLLLSAAFALWLIPTWGIRGAVLSLLSVELVRLILFILSIVVIQRAERPLLKTST